MARNPLVYVGLLISIYAIPSFFVCLTANQLLQFLDFGLDCGLLFLLVLLGIGLIILGLWVEERGL